MNGERMSLWTDQATDAPTTDGAFLVKVAAALVGFWLGLPVLVQALIVFQAIDLVMGALVAVGQRQWDDLISLKGITRKVVVLVLMVMLAAIDYFLGAVNVPLMGAAASFYIAHELMSIVQHASAAGVSIPGPLQDYFAGIVARLRGD